MNPIKTLLQEISPQGIGNHIRSLQGVRHPVAAPAALQAAADYIHDHLQSWGYRMQNHSFTEDGHEYRNIIGLHPSTQEPESKILVIAHYDTVAASPGANDNASGVAAMLELARVCQGSKFRKSILFVGVNPGLWTAATQTHFCHPSNRFYPALREAGIISFSVDTDTGMTEPQRHTLTGIGVGITNLVNRATVRASELGDDELRAGAERLLGVVAKTKPAVVAVAGITAYRTAFGRPRAVMGRQPDGFDGSIVWVVPNPSGLNAHETIDTLAVWYREAANAAGVT